jgi:hypothetical protein
VRHQDDTRFNREKQNRAEHGARDEVAVKIKPNSRQEPRRPEAS